ncbi:MAG: AzlC family ABC transporter permease [Ruminococcus sp.]|nr:AzlC family ABC transporter permease [Ruminococcus sp.]MBR6395002.1 AzlC family ABC transporter permease [Ruminococcus sp.]MCR5731306.1 AzlC family ABC transporter permease [Ruminococcus sp.]
MRSRFVRGMYHGIPIALGYLSVSFGFGIMAVRAGLTPLAATLISASNLTSAGQAAGVDIIAASGAIIEMILVQLTINIRYSLMALSLSQKLDKKFSTPHRFAASFGITDEIFAVCSAQIEPLTPAYMYGMILVAFLGWVSGTALGAAAGQLLPAAVSSALGIVLYGMFLAIIIPPSRKHKSVLIVVLAAAAVSILFRYVITVVSGGFAVIISAVIASAVGALLFPVKDEEAEE